MIAIMINEETENRLFRAYAKRRKGEESLGNGTIWRRMREHPDVDRVPSESTIGRVFSKTYEGEFSEDIRRAIIIALDGSMERFNAFKEAEREKDAPPLDEARFGEKSVESDDGQHENSANASDEFYSAGKEFWTERIGPSERSKPEPLETKDDPAKNEETASHLHEASGDFFERVKAMWDGLATENGQSQQPAESEEDVLKGWFRYDVVRLCATHKAKAFYVTYFIHFGKKLIFSDFDRMIGQDISEIAARIPEIADPRFEKLNGRGQSVPDLDNYKILGSKDTYAWKMKQAVGGLDFNNKCPHCGNLGVYNCTCGASSCYEFSSPELPVCAHCGEECPEDEFFNIDYIQKTNKTGSTDP